MLVGNEPRVLTLEADSGTYAANVYDFWRPFGRREALVDGKFSVECYLDALAGAFTQLPTRSSAPPPSWRPTRR